MRVFYLLAIVFVVDGHTTNGHLFEMNGLFRYYAFHLMMFAFGSGYFFKLYGGACSDLAHRAKKLLVPLYLWNAVYGVGAALLRRFGGFELGAPLSPYTLLLAPITDGEHFVWNLGAWFIFPLFCPQVAYALIRRLSRLWHENEAMTFLLCLIPGCAAVQLCFAGRQAALPLWLLRPMILLPGLAGGQLDRRVLEKRDSLPTVPYLLCIVVLRVLLSTRYESLAYLLSNCSYFGCGAFGVYAGAALAIAVLNFLHNMTCRTIATTHYSELKVFALTAPGVENACCEFNVETLRPTYRLLIGIPGKSNAFAISRKLGLPDYIIDEAKNQMEQKDESFEDLLANLENSGVTIEKEREEIASYKQEIETLKNRLQQKEERFSEQKEKMLSKAREEAQKILQDAKDTADQTIRNINKLAKSSGVNKELEAERTKLRGKIQDVDKKLAVKKTAAPKKAVSAKKLRLGDTVRVLSMNLKGTVSSLPNAKGDLYVQMGILRSLVNIRDLEMVEEASITGPGLSGTHTGGSRGSGSGSSKIKMSKSFSVSPEVNLIGMTVDEAIPVLDKYLDDAYLAHLPQVRVVHGRGTGALKAGVHRHLKKLSYVKEYRLGEFGEGDTGVTIVTFK